MYSHALSCWNRPMRNSEKLGPNNSRLNGIADGFDKRSSGFKHRKEAPMDSWFTHEPLIQEMRDREPHVDGQRIGLNALYATAARIEGKTESSFVRFGQSQSRESPSRLYSSVIDQRWRNAAAAKRVCGKPPSEVPHSPSIILATAARSTTSIIPSLLIS